MQRRRCTGSSRRGKRRFGQPRKYAGSQRCKWYCLTFQTPRETNPTTVKITTRIIESNQGKPAQSAGAGSKVALRQVWSERPVIHTAIDQRAAPLRTRKELAT